MIDHFILFYLFLPFLTVFLFLFCLFSEHGDWFPGRWGTGHGRLAHEVPARRPFRSRGRVPAVARGRLGRSRWYFISFSFIVIIYKSYICDIILYGVIYVCYIPSTVLYGVIYMLCRLYYMWFILLLLYMFYIRKYRDM